MYEIWTYARSSDVNNIFFSKSILTIATLARQLLRLRTLILWVDERDEGMYL